MHRGYIKIYRAIFIEGTYSHSRDYLHLFLHLIALANHKDTETTFNGKTILIKRGQLLTGRDSLSKKTGLHRSKIDRYLDTMRVEQQIEQQATTKYRIITILNYNKYQDAEQQIEQQTSNKRATNEHILSIKELKKEKNNTIHDFFLNLWNTKAINQPKVVNYTEKRKRMVEQRWKEQPTEEYWIKYIEKINGSAFLTGKTDRPFKADFDFAFRKGMHEMIVLENKYCQNSIGNEPNINWEKIRQEVGE